MQNTVRTWNSYIIDFALQEPRTPVRGLRSHNGLELPHSSTTRKNLGVLERTDGPKVPRRGNRRTGAKYAESGGTVDTAPSLAALHTTLDDGRHKLVNVEEAKLKAS